tara:strand:+ start:604 stop:1032 length:429 start_codon:yes stop_codon:yes gene_type:complete
MTMKKPYKILLSFIKDLSVETKDTETLLFVKDRISSYQLGIDINSKALKNKMVEVSTTLSFKDKNNNDKQSLFTLVYATIIKIDDDLKDKKILEKIILCDVQKEIYKNLERIFINLLHDSGFPNIKFEKKIDFEKLYNERLN